MNWKHFALGAVAAIVVNGVLSILTGTFVGLRIATDSAALAAPAASAASAASLRHAIDVGNAKFLKALESGDGKAFAALFAPDGVELPSGGGDATTGRPAIEADETASAKAAKITGGSIHTTNVYADGGVAYETGTYVFEIVLPGKPAKNAIGRYFEIWERQPDGSWLIKVDCGYPDKYSR